MKILAFLMLVVSCEKPLPPPLDRVETIGKCSQYNWCHATSELGKKGIMYRPMLGELVCGVDKSPSVEMEDRLIPCPSSR